MYRLARFNKKAPTGAKAPYVIFNPHTLPPLVATSSIKAEWQVIIATIIDPGIYNCAIRQGIQDLVTLTVKTNMQIKADFTHESLNNTKIDIPGQAVGADTSYYAGACKVLDEFMFQFQWCHYIVVESQLPINYDLVRMSQHIISYIMAGVKDKGLRPLIIEIDPHLKSRMLDAPPKMSKPQLKKWCRNKAIEILIARGDHATAQLIKEASKGDDHGDVVCYEEIWWMILRGALHAPPVPASVKILERGADKKAPPGALAAFVNGDRLPLPPEAPVKVSRLNVVKPSRLNIVKPSRLNIVTTKPSRLKICKT